MTVGLGPEWWVGVTEVNSEGGAREGQKTCQEREQLMHSPGVGCNLVPRKGMRRNAMWPELSKQEGEGVT